MNKTTAKKLNKLSDLIERCCVELEEAKNEMETLQEQEQDRYDNMSERMQESEKGCALYELIEALEEAVSRLDDSVTELYDISADIVRATEE